MFAGQGHLGAMPATVCDEPWDTPASRHEAACASGSVAALASGVRMLLDAAKQVSGAAGDYQVEDATIFGTLNFGGSTATTVSFVVSSPRGR
jgi:acetyl-CoA acetyltransferase